MKLKIALLHCLRAAGVFALCRSLTRRKLRILCYHGFAVGDQHEYNPMLYMTPATFERRMRMLRRLRYPLIRLDEAVHRLKGQRIGDCETVITIDDGWRTTGTLGAPIMQALGCPATIYVTTYNAERETDVFTVALNYLLWRTRPQSVSVQGVDPRVDGLYDAADFRGIADKLTARAEALDGAGRQRLLVHLAERLGISAAAEITDGRFRLMTPGEVAGMARDGFDIQLHTHRHRLSMSDVGEVQREIADNRARLEAWTGAPARHFCYPSGQHSSKHPAWLEAMGVESATTCEPGLNDQRTNVYALRRFLDSEAISDIEFEAELAGVGSALRSIRSALRPGNDG